jgi:hypothetical protein
VTSSDVAHAHEDVRARAPTRDGDPSCRYDAMQAGLPFLRCASCCFAVVSGRDWFSEREQAPAPVPETRGGCSALAGSRGRRGGKSPLVKHFERALFCCVTRAGPSCRGVHMEYRRVFFCREGPQEL